MAGEARYLARDERLVLETRRHVVVLLRPFVTAVGAVVAALAIGFVLSPTEGADAVDVLAGLAASFFFVRLLWKLWEWWVDRLVVTDQRVLESSGLITRRVASMPLEKVTDMVYQRSLGGRVLGYGDLIVESAGQEQGLSRIDRIPEPDHFYRTLTTLVTQGLPSLLPDDPELMPTPPDEADTGPLPQIIV